MREVSALGRDLRLKRRISMTLGQPVLTIHDRVENHGYETTPHMLLYHFNLGFPLLSPQSHLEVEFDPGRATRPCGGKRAGQTHHI